MSSDEDEDIEYNRIDHTHAIPALSKNKYNKAYEYFQKWNKLNGETPVTQNALLKYFMDMADEKKKKPTTLWAYYSMLKSTIRLNDHIDITPWSKVLDYLKRKNAGYKPHKATYFTEGQLEKFINEAPDEEWLDVKVNKRLLISRLYLWGLCFYFHLFFLSIRQVACIFSMHGAHSSRKLASIQIEHLKEYENYYWVLVPNAEIKQSFTITGALFNYVKRYLSLRPKKVYSNRFFLHYNDGKCSDVPMGHMQFYRMPRKIAQYLKLSKPEQYAGNEI